MTTAIAPIQEIQSSLVKMQDSFAEMLPKHIPADRFIAVAKTALINKPDLASLERNSLYQSFYQAAQDGLYPDGKEAAIVPFKGKAKYMPMVAGVLKKAKNSGEISIIDSQVVHELDTYESWIDEKGPHFKHVRAKGNRGEIILTYAYAIAKDGGVFLEEIDEEEMKKIKAMSRASDSPWNGPFASEMRRKSALRRLCKYRLPSSSDLTATFERDDEIYEDEPASSDTPKETITRPTRLSNIIESEVTISEAAETSLEDAVEMVQEVMPEAKVVTPPPPTKTSTKAPAGTKVVTGAIEDIKVKDGNTDGKAWRRFAVKVGGLMFGTFDSKFGESFSQALDDGKHVRVTYKERQSNGSVYRDIVDFEVDGEIPI